MTGPEELADRVAAAGVRDPRLLDAIRRTPREAFVPEEHVGRAYLDQPIPIGHRQVTTQPSLAAAMVEALQLEGSERVLEVGTGLGWQTALLARLAARVFSFERWEDLAEEARRNLRAAGVTNVEVRVGDGSRGWAEAAPYAAVLVSAAYGSVPEPLVEQLETGGRLVQPIGPGGAEDVTLYVKAEKGLERRRRITGACFVRLVGEHGFAS